MSKTFLLQDTTWIANAVDENGIVNTDELKFNLLKIVLTNYANTEKFQYLVFFNKRDLTFYLFDINEEDTFNKLISLKLCWPSYGTVEGKDRADSAITLPN